jgi:hypothetical protein
MGLYTEGRLFCGAYFKGRNFSIMIVGCELVLPNQKGVAEVVPDGHFSR